MHKRESSSSKRRSPGPDAVSTHGRVLFMDDKEIVRNAVSEVLRVLGYEVECAVEGEQALRMYRRAREAGAPFDVVVLDLTVASGMGGREAIEKLLEIDPSAKIVVSSGYPNDPVIVDYSRYGARDVIIKPYNSSELDEVLERVLRE